MNRFWFFLLPGLMGLGLIGTVGGQEQDAAASPPSENLSRGTEIPGFSWQTESGEGIRLVGEEDIPDHAFGDMVRLGRNIFTATREHAQEYVGPDNELDCVNCHLGAGRKSESAPLWAARLMYPEFNRKSEKVVTLVERIQRCFEYSLNGKAPAVDSREMTALIAYSHWLATGLPTGVPQNGRFYPRLPPPAEAHDPKRGEAVYLEQCAICHGTDGGGLTQESQVIFPPLWGKGAYSWAADMQRLDIAAGFIHANMPLGNPRSLTEQQAWDVAAYINSRERPQDPRFTGSVTETAERFHQNEITYYGKEVDGRLLGRGIE